MTLPSQREYVLTVACPERPGIVHAVSSFLVEHAADIVRSQQYDDRGTGRFFMRVQFEVLGVDPGGRASPDPRRAVAPRGVGDSLSDLQAGDPHGDGGVCLGDLEGGFARVAEAYGMSWRITPAAARTRTLIMVSRQGHCLNDLLFRAQAGALPVDVAAIVSNHPDFAGLAAARGVPFHHIPVGSGPGESREEAEARLLELVDTLGVELVVLARYMRILSEDTCKRLDGQLINIHHSFLPSFKGARPYEQAYERGVKLVGATAHYVTADLDEGPIIEQDVARVDHASDAAAFAEVGRDVEAQVLARAVAWHTEHRILLNGSRTVIFR
ncbi:MAG TPA: formyltetrahydrofolate deformylase [Streptosporangiaceae bacterium]|jgi:formyltetrahydrofolate deformylase